MAPGQADVPLFLLIPPAVSVPLSSFIEDLVVCFTVWLRRKKAAPKSGIGESLWFFNLSSLHFAIILFQPILPPCLFLSRFVKDVTLRLAANKKPNFRPSHRTLGNAENIPPSVYALYNHRHAEYFHPRELCQSA
jgi:hypothetical protein